jgi:acyl-CoA thioesterase-1
MHKIGVWGDSIAWGSADDEQGGWVSRLRQYVDNEHESGPTVYNLSVRGDKVKDVLKRFNREYKAIRPETVILAIGINDSPHRYYTKGTPLDVFEKDLVNWLQKLHLSPTN